MRYENVRVWLPRLIVALIKDMSGNSMCSGYDDTNRRGLYFTGLAGGLVSGGEPF